jgi:hypothetical protein
VLPRPFLLISWYNFLVSLNSLHCPCTSCWLSGCHFLDSLSKLADMLFQCSHSCYEFCVRFTDSFCRYLIFLLILLPAFFAVNPYYLTLFLRFLLPFQSCNCCSPTVTETHFSLSLCCWHFHLEITLVVYTCLFAFICSSPPNFFAAILHSHHHFVGKDHLLGNTTRNSFLPQET